MVGVFAQLCTAVLAFDVPFEPQPGALSGLWPAPANASASGACLCLSEAAFKVSVKSTLSPPAVERLRRAIHRTEAKIFTPAARPHLHQSVAAYAASPTLTALAIYVTSDDLTLSRRTDESYALSIEGTPPAATLRAPSVYGALHGLETFSQLVLRGSGLGGPCSAVINASQLAISDAPRFRWRGLMLDSARHYLPVEAITAMLDAMSFNKLNVLHWHISDTQSFPLLTKATPALARGAYSPALVYTADDVRTIVGFAADRGIRVVPELDSPGHATSWSVGYPNATLPRCQTLDPTSDAAFALLEALFAEVASLFPDEYMHIGADEVDFACWNSSATVVSYMQRRGIARDDAGFKELTAKYIGRLTALVAKSGKTAVAWQEAMDHYGPTAANPTPPSARLPPDLVVEQWLQPAWNWANLSAITGQGYLGRPDATWPTGRSGFEALVTLGWYLDDTASLNAWEEAYAREPLTNKTCVYDAAGHEAACSCSCPSGPWRDGKCHCFDLRGSAKAAKVLGGEAPLWGEHIDHTNLEPRAFPRASAVAERLWSPVWRNNASAAAPRLLKHRCRMIERGVRVTPLGPGFC